MKTLQYHQSLSLFCRVCLNNGDRFLKTVWCVRWLHHWVYRPRGTAQGPMFGYIGHKPVQCCVFNAVTHQKGSKAGLCLRFWQPRYNLPGPMFSRCERLVRSATQKTCGAVLICWLERPMPAPPVPKVNGVPHLHQLWLLVILGKGRKTRNCGERKSRKETTHPQSSSAATCWPTSTSQL